MKKARVGSAGDGQDVSARESVPQKRHTPLPPAARAYVDAKKTERERRDAHALLERILEPSSDPGNARRLQVAYWRLIEAFDRHPELAEPFAFPSSAYQSLRRALKNGAALPDLQHAQQAIKSAKAGDTRGLRDLRIYLQRGDVKDAIEASLAPDRGAE